MKGVNGFIFVLVAILAVLITLFAALAETPGYKYCEGFGEINCIDNYKWFDIEGCKTEIACIPIFSDYQFYTDEEGDIVHDVHVFRYKNFERCFTMYRYNYSNCNRYPTEFCYNWEAYDIDNPINCSCDRGQRFRKLDICGNPTEEFSECIRTETCQQKTITPYTNIPVTVNLNCSYYKRKCINPETSYTCRKKAERKRECVNSNTVFIQLQNVEAPCCADGCIVDEDEPWIDESYENCLQNQTCNNGYCISREELDRIEEEQRKAEEEERKQEEVNQTSKENTKIKPNVIVSLKKKGGINPIIILAISLSVLIVIAALLVFFFFLRRLSEQNNNF